jgi:hypothetical protein
MTLAEALSAAAAGLEGIEQRESADGSIEWSVDGRPFAACRDARAEFRLPPAIARAALGTADTGGSVRGTDWVSFTPAELDRFSLDRATAWLASARRHA